MGVLGRDGRAVALAAAGGSGARLLVIGGAPLREPIARYGPFVMNTRAELVEAIEDLQSGRFAQSA
jgi:redox-sensitive bicupin YhaK (pirin superfamily)